MRRPSSQETVLLLLIASAAAETLGWFAPWLSVALLVAVIPATLFGRSRHDRNEKSVVRSGGTETLVGILILLATAAAARWGGLGSTVFIGAAFGVGSAIVMLGAAQRVGSDAADSPSRFRKSYMELAVSAAALASAGIWFMLQQRPTVTAVPTTLAALVAGIAFAMRSRGRRLV